MSKTDEILLANEKDLTAARANNIAPALLNRLKLTEASGSRLCLETIAFPSRNALAQYLRISPIFDFGIQSAMYNVWVICYFVLFVLGVPYRPRTNFVFRATPLHPPLPPPPPRTILYPEQDQGFGRRHIVASGGRGALVEVQQPPRGGGRAHPQTGIAGRIFERHMRWTRRDTTAHVPSSHTIYSALNESSW